MSFFRKKKRADLDISSCMSWSSQPLYNYFFVDKHSHDVTHLYQFVPPGTNNYNELINNYKPNFTNVLTFFSEIEKTEELGEGVWFCI